MPDTKKTYVLDTSVLLHSSSSIRSFEDNNVVIPYVVLEELDKFKTRDDDVGKNARQVTRDLNALREQGLLSHGVPVNERGGTLRVELGFLEPQNHSLEVKSNDDRILNVCLGLSKTENTILVSKDINLVVRADVFGIPAEDFYSDRPVDDVADLYTGTAVLTVPAEIIDAFYAGENVYPDLFTDQQLFPNQYLTLVSAEDPGKTALGRVQGSEKPIARVKSYKNISGVSPRNREQQFLADALMSDATSIVSVTGAAGCGKAQPLDAEVLTPSGYVKMGSIKIGDVVSTPDGGSANVIGVFPQGKLPIYRVEFSDGTSTECCDDHLWETQTELDRAKGRRGSVKSLKEIRETLNSREHTGSPRSNHSIPMTQPVAFAENRNLPIDPYLLGLLLGDGGLSHPGSVYISSADEEITSYCSSISDEYTITKCSGDNYDYRFVMRAGQARENALKKHLIGLELFGCKSEDKFIPHIYKYSSPENRLAVLQGLLDTDGSINVVKNSYSLEFTTVSCQLAEDVQFLVESLGGKAVSNVRQTAYTYKGEKKEGQTSIRMHISFPPHLVPFRLTRKVEKYTPRDKYKPTRYIRTVELVGEKEAQCILIDSDDHLYLTNNFIVTHNTLISLACCLQMMDEGRYDKLIVSRPIQPMGKDIGFLPGTVMEKMDPWMGPIKDAINFLTKGKSKPGFGGGPGHDAFTEMVAFGMIEVEPLTYIRGRSLPRTLFLIDEAEDLTRSEIKTIVSRMGDDSKIILIGDIMQITNPYVDSTNNGLSIVAEKFKDYKFAAHLTLTKGERSELATVASKIL